MAEHLDYLHLAGGLAWLLFACLIRFAQNWKNPAAATWLQAAVITLAVGQWSRVLNDSMGSNATHELVNFYLAILPGFLLVEFALEIHPGKNRWRAVRGLLYAALLVWSGWLMETTSQQNKLLLQTSLVLPGVLASLALLHGANWRHSVEGRWLLLATLGLAAFVASSAGLDSLDRDLLPTPGLRPEDAPGARHSRWLLSQIFTSWGAVGGLILYQRIRRQKQRPARPAGEAVLGDTDFLTRGSAPDRLAANASGVTSLAVRWVLLAWLGLLALGSVGGRLAGENRAADFRDDLLHHAILAAVAIDPDRLAGLSATANDASRPEYKSLRAQLTALREASPDFRFAYLIKTDAGRPVFFADSQPGIAPGDAYAGDDPGLRARWQTGKPFVQGPFMGSAGPFLLGFVAIADRHTGRTLGWLGLGIRATDWNLSLARARLPWLIGVWLLCLLLLSFAITHQKAAAATKNVASSERRYRQMFERNPAVMLLIDPESGRLLDANPAACKYYQLTADQLRRENLATLSPDTADKFLQQMHAIVSGSLDFFPTRHRLANGELRDVEICAGPVDTGERCVLHCIVQDVTERHLAEAELHKREVVLGGIAESGQLLLVDKNLDRSMQAALATLGKAVGADRVYVYENQSGGAGTPLLSGLLYQWASPRAPRRPAGSPHLPAEAIPPRWATALRSGLPVYGSLDDFDATERRQLETRGVVSFVAIPIQIDTHFWGYIGFDDCQWPRAWSQTEIDALRATAGPIGNAIIRARATEDLIRARDAAEAADRAKSEFLATMSHELRTPMNAVIGMTSLLRDTPLEPRQLDFVEAVRTSGEALMEIINDILDFSKIESGKLVIEQEDFDLRSVVDGVLDLLAPRAHAKKLELAGLFGPGVPTGLCGDDGRLRQILVNLLVNGIKFTEEGEVVLRVTCREQINHQAKLRFAVTDTGPGIPAEQQPLLFQPFTQADSTITRKHGGTGLGLAICKRLVELMGGEIGLDSQPGTGSTFWFELDFALVEPAGDWFPAHQLPPARVLVVDRHAITREAIAAMLQGWHMEYAEAFSLNQAVEKAGQARQAGKPFNLTLVENDLCIGSLAGLTGVILLTQANVSPGGALPDGVIAQLPKPLKQSQLFDCLAIALTGQTPRTGAAPKSGAHPTAGAAAFAQLRILVAEDNDVNRRLAIFMLQKLGCQSDFASDGQETIRAWEAIPYDVILMDCHMPVMDGYTATRKIRELETQPAQAGRPHTHIIAMTANAMRGDREKCLAAGMDDYISKPVRLELLQAALTRVVGTTPAESIETGPVEPELAGDVIQGIEARVNELERELGPSAVCELVTAFMHDTPGALAELTTLSRTGGREAYARAAHSLAGSCSIFGLEPLRLIALELEDCAGQGDPAVGEALISRLNQGYQACRPVLERLRAALPPATNL